MSNNFIAWVFILSFALVGPTVLFLLFASLRGYVTGSEEARSLPSHSPEDDYWQATWKGGR